MTLPVEKIVQYTCEELNLKQYDDVSAKEVGRQVYFLFLQEVVADFKLSFNIGKMILQDDEEVIVAYVKFKDSIVILNSTSFEEGFDTPRIFVNELKDIEEDAYAIVSMQDLHESYDPNNL